MGDVFIVLPLVFCVFHGIWRGPLRSMCLLAVLLFSLLASIFLTPYMELWLLGLAGLPDYPDYPGVPAVPLLLMERGVGYAFAAALIPALIVLTFLAVFWVAEMYFRPDLLFWGLGGILPGAITGFFGAILMLLQLLRLPVPLPGRFFIYLMGITGSVFPSLLQGMWKMGEI